jgi:hypothetical protein
MGHNRPVSELLGLDLDDGHIIYHEGRKVRQGHEAFFLSFERPGNCQGVKMPSESRSPEGQRFEKERFVTLANFEPFAIKPAFDPAQTPRYPS